MQMAVLWAAFYEKDCVSMATTKPKAAAAPKAKAAPKKAAPRKAAAPKAAKLVEEPRTLRDEAGTIFAQAGEKVRKAANTGKDTASNAMGDMAAMVEEVAKTLDGKLGAQYGDYARKAAGAVSGVADTLKSKEVDELLDTARDFVRTRPAVAIGAAAAVGFLLTRLIKAGSDDEA
jgi:ElaB/YqjD/DUF883 family membrane-anchored ribosome-binding protein